MHVTKLINVLAVTMNIDFFVWALCEHYYNTKDTIYLDFLVSTLYKYAQFNLFCVIHQWQLWPRCDRRSSELWTPFFSL